MRKLSRTALNKVTEKKSIPPEPSEIMRVWKNYEIRKVPFRRAFWKIYVMKLLELNGPLVSYGSDPFDRGLFRRVNFHMNRDQLSWRPIALCSPESTCT